MCVQGVGGYNLIFWMDERAVGRVTMGPRSVYPNLTVIRSDRCMCVCVYLHMYDLVVIVNVCMCTLCARTSVKLVLICKFVNVK